MEQNCKTQLLDEKQNRVLFLDHPVVKSGLKIIFHWKAQLLITVWSLCKVAALDWMSLTTEQRDVSLTKSLKFEDTPFDKLLTVDCCLKESHLICSSISESVFDNQIIITTFLL